MAIRIIEGTDYAALYCSTSMWAFGPIFEDREQAEAFLEWFRPDDPRILTDAEWETEYAKFLEYYTREREEV